MIVSLLTLGLGAGAGAATAATVTIVASERSVGYVQAAEALIVELERLGTSRSNILQSTASEWNAGDASAGGARLIVTLGTDAFAQVLQREHKVPVLAALLPRSGFERVIRDYTRKPLSAYAGVFLDQPYARQVEVLRLALPDAKRIGVLWGPESVKTQNALAAAAQARGLVLEGSQVTEGAPLFSGLRVILGQADVLLAVADAQVYNSATISNILLATYRARIPVVAFSPSYVKAGALMALYTTPAQIGVQAAGMARQILQGGANPGQLYPVEFQVTVNDHVARSLGLSLDGPALTDRLRTQLKRP